MPRKTINVVAPAGRSGTRSSTIIPLVSPSDRRRANAGAGHTDGNRWAHVERSERRQAHATGNSAEVAGHRIPSLTVAIRVS